MCMSTDSARFYCISFVAVSQDERSAARRRPALLSATLKVSYIRGCSIYKKKNRLFFVYGTSIRFIGYFKENMRRGRGFITQFGLQMSQSQILCTPCYKVNLSYQVCDTHLYIQGLICMCVQLNKKYFMLSFLGIASFLSHNFDLFFKFLLFAYCFSAAINVLETMNE